MPGKRDQNRNYKVHGTGVSSLYAGFDEIGMPPYRRSTAISFVTEVLEANGARDFYWYVPPSTPEICCYWDDAEQNQLWINPGQLHISSDETRTKRPARPLTFSKQDGQYVGWFLPGGQSGTGGGPAPTQVATVVCPVTFLHVPAGVPCSDCEIIHDQ